MNNSIPGLPPSLTRSDLSNPLLLAKLREAETISRELMVRRALEDKYYWFTQCTKTKDEQDLQDPYKPFPDKDYIWYEMQYLDNWPKPVKALEKSRTMMASWGVSGWSAHLGFTHPAVCTVFQSQDERRAIHDVDYVKELWKNSDPELKDRWPLPKPVERQPATEFRLSNDSRWVALSRDPDAIRSEHPTIVVLDEAAHMVEGQESYDIAVASNPLHIILLSSAAEGWYEEFCEPAVPVDWPWEMRVAV